MSDTERDQLYRKLVRAQLGYPGGNRELLVELTKLWSGDDVTSDARTLALLQSSTALAFDLLEEEQTSKAVVQ